MDLEDLQTGATTPESEPAPSDHGQTRTVEREPRQERDKPKDLKSQLRGAIAEHKDKPAAAQPPRDLEGKFTPANSKPKDGGEIASPEAAPVSSTTEAPAGAAQPASAAPASLSKEVRDLWSSLPPAVQNEFARREADGAKGVEQLKNRYQPIDQSLAPLRPLLQQRGMNEGQAVKQMVDWHMALAGPNKDQAFKALAQSYGINPSAASPQQGASQTEQPNAQDILRPYLDPLLQKVGALESQFERNERLKVDGEIAAFSKDKPHFEKVKQAMGQMLASGFAASLDDAYLKATWADPEVRAQILQEQQDEQRKKAEQAEADRKRQQAEQAEKARRAAVSPKAGTPGSTVNPRQKNVSVGSTIRDVVRSARGSV